MIIRIGHLGKQVFCTLASGFGLRSLSFVRHVDIPPTLSELWVTGRATCLPKLDVSGRDLKEKPEERRETPGKPTKIIPTLASGLIKFCSLKGAARQWFRKRSNALKEKARPALV